MDKSALSQSYTGTVAEHYDQRRAGKKKWRNERAAVQHLTEALTDGSSLLDVPIGTGRFLPIYKDKRLTVIGADASVDMLQQARKTADEIGIDEIRLLHGNIFELPFGEGEFDTVLCIRFLNWLDRSDMQAAIRELNRVSRKSIILGIRHYVPWPRLIRRRGIPMLAVRQIKVRIKRLFSRDHLVVHAQKAIQRVIDQNKLHVEDRIIIEKRNDGTEYVFYRLGKTGHDRST